MWRKGNPLALLVGIKLIQPLWRTVWRFLKNLKIELPYDPAIPLLGIYLEKNMVPKDTCTPTFIAALFTISKTWNQIIFLKLPFVFISSVTFAIQIKIYFPSDNWKCLLTNIFLYFQVSFFSALAESNFSNTLNTSCCSLA